MIEQKQVGSWFGLTNYLITFSANPLFEEEFQRGQALAKRMGAVLASYDVTMSVRGALFVGRPIKCELL
jgi:hypothetical protein